MTTPVSLAPVTTRFFRCRPGGAVHFVGMSSIQAISDQDM
jgi:hypothetical protein